MNSSDSKAPQNPTPPPAEDLGFRDRRLPGTPAGEARGILPGMAMIGIYLLVLSMLNAFAAIHGNFGPGLARYGILGVSTILVMGVFGFLRLQRWGWAIVTAGCILMSAADIYAYTKTHVGFFVVRGLFSFLFFLYLARTEVRERLR
ncbi:MAG TPA: hypothetical protein VGN16_10205 [Acidobacteriaceae bacterium]|jgi:hypothetical protein